MKFSEKLSKFHLSTVKAWLLQCWPLLITKIPMENKSGMDSEVMRECGVAGCVQLCPALCDPGSCSPPGSTSVGFSRQECWSALPCPPPGELPDPGIEPKSLGLLHWNVGSLTQVPLGKPEAMDIICFPLITSVPQRPLLEICSPGLITKYPLSLGRGLSQLLDYSYDKWAWTSLWHVYYWIQLLFKSCIAI